MGRHESELLLSPGRDIDRRPTARVDGLKCGTTAEGDGSGFLMPKVLHLRVRECQSASHSSPRDHHGSIGEANVRATCNWDNFVMAWNDGDHVIVHVMEVVEQQLRLIGFFRYLRP